MGVKEGFSRPLWSCQKCGKKNSVYEEFDFDMADNRINWRYVCDECGYTKPKYETCEWCDHCDDKQNCMRRILK